MIFTKLSILWSLISIDVSWVEEAEWLCQAVTVVNSLNMYFRNVRVAFGILGKHLGIMGVNWSMIEPQIVIESEFAFLLDWDLVLLLQLSPKSRSITVCSFLRCLPCGYRRT